MLRFVCALAVVSAVKQREPQATRSTTATEQCAACSVAVMSARNTVMKAVHKGAKPPTKARWKQILRQNAQLAEGQGLDPRFVEEVYKAIHQASIAAQRKVIRDRAK